MISMGSAAYGGIKFPVILTETSAAVLEIFKKKFSII